MFGLVSTDVGSVGTVVLAAVPGKITTLSVVCSVRCMP